MKRKLVIALLTAAGWLVALTPPVAAQDAGIDADLDALLEILPGEFAGLAPKGMAPDGEMHRLVHSFTPVDVPQIGDRVVLYRVMGETAEGPILQAKLFVFSTNPGRATNTMHALVMTPDQAEFLRDAGKSEWHALDPEKLMSFPEECFFTWERVGETFAGKGSTVCSYESRAFKQTITPEMQYQISEKEFGFEETLLGEDGRAIVSTGGLLTATRM